MADQKRWFKLWHSASSDDALQSLPPAIRWAWAALGAYTKVHGTRGRVIVGPRNAVLAAEMGVAIDALKSTILMLPHIDVEEGNRVNGEFTVTWHNWVKYQEDSTVAKRVACLRSKRRGEEKRTEEKRTEETTPPRIPLTSPNGHRGTKLPDEQFLTTLKQSPAYQGIDVDRELARMDAWLLTPAGQRRQKTRRFIVNWLNRVDRPMTGGTKPTSRATLNDKWQGQSTGEVKL